MNAADKAKAARVQAALDAQKAEKTKTAAFDKANERRAYPPKLKDSKLAKGRGGN